MGKPARTLRPVSGWEVIWRGSFAARHRGVDYAIDLDFFDFSERIHLYRDGEFAETRKSPATFTVDDDTTLEASMSLYGMKRAHLVHRGEGRAVQLSPRPGTAEARRAAFAKRFPALNRWIGLLAWAVLVFAALTQLPVIYNATIAQWFDATLPTLALPGWLNITLAVAGLLAAIDRALQLQHNRWIDE